MNPPAPDDRGCLEPETLAAWHERTLSASDLEAVDGHLADCERCQALLAAFVRTDVAAAIPATPVAESLWRRWRLAWLVPVATAATVAAIWVAIPDRDASTRPPAAESDLAASAERQVQALESGRAGQASADLQEADLTRVQADAAQSDAATARAETVEERLARVPAAAPPRAEAQVPASPAEVDAAASASVDLADRGASPAAAAVAQFRAALPVVEVASPDPAVRWRLVDGRIERTTTDGGDWDSVTGVEGGRVLAGAAPTATVCWLVGPAGTVYLATDGTTFERLPFPEAADLTAVTASDEQTATVTAADGRTWRTTDAGQTWE